MVERTHSIQMNSGQVHLRRYTSADQVTPAKGQAQWSVRFSGPEFLGTKNSERRRYTKNGTQFLGSLDKGSWEKGEGGHNLFEKGSHEGKESRTSEWWRRRVREMGCLSATPGLLLGIRRLPLAQHRRRAHGEDGHHLH